jgi:hypothetical protein
LAAAQFRETLLAGVRLSALASAVAEQLAGTEHGGDGLDFFLSNFVHGLPFG